MAINEKVIIILSWLLKRKIRVLLKRSSMGVDFCGESKASPDEAHMYGLPVDDSWLPPESSARATLYLANRQSPPAPTTYELDQCVSTIGTPQGCWHLRGAASVSIESRGRSAMLKDSAPPAGHDDSSAFSVLSLSVYPIRPRLCLWSKTTARAFRWPGNDRCLCCAVSCP